MATIVENLNKMIENNGGEQHGSTIAECVSLLDDALANNQSTRMTPPPTNPSSED